MTNNSYNLYNLELEFKIYLTENKQSSVTVKNYLADIRKFLGHFLNDKAVAEPYNDLDHKLGLLTTQNIKEYRNYLSSLGLSKSTINRHLSSIRLFCSFLVEKKYLTTNPTNDVGNISIDETLDILALKNTLISEFEKDLILENMDKTSIKNYLLDVAEFLDASNKVESKLLIK